MAKYVIRRNKNGTKHMIGISAISLVVAYTQMSYMPESRSLT